MFFVYSILPTHPSQEIRARQEPTPKNGAALGRLQTVKVARTVWSGEKAAITSKPYLSLCKKG